MRSSHGSGAADAGPRSRQTLVLVGLFVAALHAAMFNRDFTVDGLAYATAVENGALLFHSNHLVFASLHYALWEALQALSLAPTRAIWLMQAVTATCGVATVVALCAYLMPRAGALRAAVLAGLFATTFAFWNFSQEPEAYVPPLLCVALSLALLRDPLRVPGAGRIALLIGLAVLAVLLLQQYVLWYPALLLLLASRLRSSGRVARGVQVAAIVIPIACLAAYLAIGASLGRMDDVNALAQWLLGYGYDPDAGLATYRDPPALSARAIGFVLGLGNLVFAYEVALSPASLLAAAVVGIALIAILTPAWIAALRTGSIETAAMTIFLVGNAVFALWWESRNIEFLLPLAFAAVAIAGLGARCLHVPALALVAVGVMTINIASAFWPQRETPARYLQALALHRDQVLSSSDAVIVEELNTLRWLGYFHRADAQFLSGAVSAAMHGDRALEAARAELLAAVREGRRVYTFERGEHGRLRALAERFAVLGRAGYRGEVESELQRLYDGLRLEPVPQVAGAQRVLPAVASDATPAQAQLPTAQGGE